jgi:hypothetical protein
VRPKPDAAHPPERVRPAPRAGAASIAGQMDDTLPTPACRAALEGADAALEDDARAPLSAGQRKTLRDPPKRPARPPAPA